MSTEQNNDERERNERERQNSENQFPGDDSQRLSKYDNGNETDDTKKPQSDESKYENSYGFNSDSSRTVDARENDATFENDAEGQRLDDMSEEARDAGSQNTQTENRDRSNQRWHSEDDRNRE